MIMWFAENLGVSNEKRCKETIIYETSRIFDFRKHNNILTFLKDFRQNLGINYKFTCVLGKPVVIHQLGARVGGLAPVSTHGASLGPFLNASSI